MLRAGRMVQRNALVYRRVWRGSLFSSFLQPTLFLSAMGLGVGSLVDRGAATLPHGVSYLTFMDAIFLNAYFMIFVAAVASVVGHFLIRTSGSSASAERFSRLGQRAFPLVVLLSNAALALKFLL